MLLDEDNALIGTFDEEEDESPLYINYISDSYDRNDDNDANKSCIFGINV